MDSLSSQWGAGHSEAAQKIAAKWGRVFLEKLYDNTFKKAAISVSWSYLLRRDWGFQNVEANGIGLKIMMNCNQ
jgi:hypothetical protein